MIAKVTFRKTEGYLYGYFRDLKEIDSLEFNYKELEEQKEVIENYIDSWKIYLDSTKNMLISKIQKFLFR